MFCYQCQETAKNTGCTSKGVCGKDERTSNLQDLLIYTARGVALCLAKSGKPDDEANAFIIDSLFMTITNVNFDPERVAREIKRGLEIRERIKQSAGDTSLFEGLHDCATWSGGSIVEFEAKASSVGILPTENEDTRSLRELIIYGLKGMRHTCITRWCSDSTTRMSIPLSGKLSSRQ